MRATRIIFATLGVAALAVSALGPGGATAASEGANSPTGVSMRAPLTPIYATQGLGVPTTVESDAVPGKVATATFTVTYTGFTPAAKASFQRAVNYWASQLTSSVPIVVQAKFSPLGPGVLGSAGPYTLWRDFPGAPRPGTFYVDAIANKRQGSQVSAANPDIIANFSSAFSNWYYGTGRAPVGQYDFESVVLHELGHGLGFLGAGNVTSGKGSVRFATSAGSFPSAYDRFTETGSGKSLLSYPDTSAALKTALTSGNVVFDSPKVRNANGGKTAKLFAPGTWQQGSSYSHLDENTYRAGNVNSLMTPAIGDGESIRAQGPITKAIFTSIGW